GLILQKQLNLEGEWGLLLLRSYRGIEFIDRLARLNTRLWKGFADFGLVLGFGISSYFLFSRRERNLKLYLLSLVALALIALFILPLVLPIAFSVISFPVDIYAEAQSNAAARVSVAGFNLFQIGLILVLMLGGLCTIGVAGLLLKGLSVTVSLIETLLGNVAALSTTAPGATFLLPGINLPLFEGIVALIVLLVVHEVSHGLLARIGNIKLKSSGVVLFGILPMGAFIDPDEKALRKKERMIQYRVLVAGSTANFITAVFTLVLLLAFLSAHGSFKDERVIITGTYAYPARGNLTAGSTLLEVDGAEVSTLAQFNAIAANWKPNQTVSVLTSAGALSLITNSEGKLGVFAEQPYKMGFTWLGPLYNILALVFVLNFLVGAVNLLPIPMFDGHRIVALAVGDEKKMRYITALVLVLFLLNFLPWVWQ
ncbi:MAG: site-2 protease family protein, partial [Candidatus Micrarchaeota archaeon]